MNMHTISHQQPPPPAVSADPSPQTLRSWVETALRACGCDPTAEVDMRILDIESMADLNHRFLGKSGPTNSLAFPVADGEPDNFLGDIALCGEVIRREADQRQIPHRAHWAHLCIHATLHLLGHDHQQSDQAQVMEGLESQIMLGLGFADPWAVQR